MKFLSLCSAFALAACDKNPAPTPVHPAATASTATAPPAVKTGIRGLVQERFLPNPVNGRGLPVSVTPRPGETITVRHGGNDFKEFGTVTTGSDGRFFIPLPPGSYEVIYRSHRTGEDIIRRVTVDAGQQSSEVVLESVLAQP